MQFDRHVFFLRLQLRSSIDVGPNVHFVHLHDVSVLDVLKEYLL
jgi:hypothetical protein